VGGEYPQSEKKKNIDFRSITQAACCELSTRALASTVFGEETSTTTPAMSHTYTCHKEALSLLLEMLSCSNFCPAYGR
jgi:hypothetical protein